MTPQTPKSSDSDLKLKPSKKAAVPEAESSHRYLWEETESASLSSGIPVPATHTLYQQLHNYPVGDSGKECASLTKGCEDNIQPIRRAVEHLERTRQPRGGTPRGDPHAAVAQIQGQVMVGPKSAHGNPHFLHSHSLAGGQHQPPHYTPRGPEQSRSMRENSWVLRTNVFRPTNPHTRKSGR